MLRVPSPGFPPQEIALSKVRVRSIDQQRSFLLLLLATVTLLAAAFVGAAVAYAQDAEEPTGSPVAAEATADDELVSDGIDGTWTVDTEIGDFEEFSGSWVGFRVAEVLDRFGDVEAVGRTPVVSGELVVSGSTIESATIEADLTTIRSDQVRRDPAIQRALNTREFPSATFESTAAVDLGAVPVDGEPFTASVPGLITIHGVSQDATLDLTGQRVGDVVVVVGTLPLDFTSFGVTMPTAPVVVSVEDHGDLEWQLFFSREG
jgi:polyisoprenoid-binding protein YceI